MQVHGHATGRYYVHVVYCPGTGTYEGFRRPNPAKSLPKVGHWRTTPLSKHKPLRYSGTRKAGPYLPASMPVAFAPGTYNDMPDASVRQRVRAAVAAGIIAPADAPTWAQP